MSGTSFDFASPKRQKRTWSCDWTSRKILYLFELISFIFFCCI